ncbi:uncharacterized protein LOC132737592 isoform X2 [Ruditapes philippinarum]|uniref:uncharacterized protein LOC132737592 isoform X2 n=1 Tax=Ruditapes philippinarum TaxID=129788 RepID=UPI00295C18D9|nr:uncharacterized protein LOC132737592 isoform X2 [Ruditapes philippinarum]
MDSKASSNFPRKEKLKNFERAFLALHITKEGIRSAVSDKVESYYEEFLTDIYKKLNIDSGSKCGGCYTRNIVARPFTVNSNDDSGCPKKICNYLKYKIKANHRNRKPNYDNTDAKQWYSNPWELAKCFMPEGYRKVKSAAETDFFGVINVVINHEIFPVDNCFKQGKLISNDIRHSGSLELNDEELQKIFTTLNNILVFPEFFDKARDARKELEKLNNHNQFSREMVLESVKETKMVENLFLKIEELEMRLLKIEISRNPYEADIKQSTKIEGEGTNKQNNYGIPKLHPRDGKLIKLKDNELQMLLQCCSNEPVKGGFGQVYISQSKVPGLDIYVVLKKITCEDNEKTKIITTFNEKISRKVMHFAIVPLIGYMEKKISSSRSEYYFLSPYLKNGSLRSCIDYDEEEKDREKIKLKHRRRIEILFQVASAIHYLHTPVKDYRGTVLHMDITSSNIVLDKHLNARLIDFGLAREMNEGQTKVSLTQSKQFGTPGYFPTKRYSELTVREDYYNFGVVIREILTGKLPYIKTNGEPDELRSHGEGTIKMSLQTNVWHTDVDGIQEKVDKLVSLSARCLERNKKKDSVTSAVILKDLKEIRVKEDFIRDLRKKCDICMINPCVENNKGLSTHKCCGDQCYIAINVCLPCMRNSHLNPLVCPTCGEKIVPEIGHTFAAVLIAGSDIYQECTQSLIDDVKEIKTVLASKYPCVIGISEERIKVVTPESPGQRDLLPKIAAAFKSLHDSKDIRTLLFYYTGHFSSSETGFLLDGNNSVLNLTDLQAHFERFCEKRKETKRIIAFLDCCEPPVIEISLPKSKQVQICQLNVCRQNEVAYQNKDGSLFRMLFVQALTRKIFNIDCIIYSDECKYCVMSGEFISITKIFDYISDHITSENKGRKPAISLPIDSTTDETCFGYNIELAAEFEFKFQNKNFEENVKIEITKGIYCDIDKLKSCIHHALCEKNDETLMFPSSKFLDTLSLQIYNGQQHGEELQYMVQVSAAMDNQQCVVVSVRPVSRILKGRVVLFPPQTEFIEYLKENKLLTESTESPRDAPATVTLSKNQLGTISTNIKYDDVLKTMSSDLNEVYKKWDNVKVSNVFLFDFFLELIKE